MKKSAPPGQMIVVAILIMAVILTAIPLLVRVKSQQTRISTQSILSVRADQAAEAAFARLRFLFDAQPALWERAVAGDPLSALGLDGEKKFPGLDEFSYSIKIEPTATLLPNALEATVTLFGGAQQARKKRLFKTLYSRQTMGVDLPDYPHVPAALYLLEGVDLSEPDATAELVVHWGAIVSFGPVRLHDEPGVSDWGPFPRKFVQSAFEASREISPPTDRREYWVDFPMGEPAALDLEKYLIAAMKLNGKIREPLGRGAAGGAVSSRRDEVAFTRAGKDPAIPLPIFFIDANTRFEAAGVDLGRGAMIITRDAIFVPPTADSEFPLRVPTQAADEYPFLPAGAQFPCQAWTGATCQAAEALEKVHFRGFLYVKGDLEVQKDLVISGVLRVDGKLSIAPGKRLTVLFDEEVSQAIFLKDARLRQRIISQPAF